MGFRLPEGFRACGIRRLGRISGFHDRAVRAGHVVPDFFGNEGDKWVKQHEGIAQHPPQHGPGRFFYPGAFLVVKRRFYGFEVPVTEFMPHKIVQRPGGLVEAVAVQGIGDFRRHPSEAGNNPFVLQRQALQVEIIVAVFQVHQGKARGIPELVDKIAVALHAFLGHLDVPSLGGKSGQGEPESIRSIAIDHIQGVDHVAF